MVEKQRKDPNFALKCKACVEAKEQEVRAAAAANAKLKAEETAGAAGAAGETADSLHECSACKANLPEAAFNRNQLRNKGPGKQRCQTCVQQTEVEEKEKLKANQTAGLNEARQNARRAEAVGTVGQKLVAASLLSAQEAHHVTGLKPMVLGRGRAGGRRGRGRR